jgi:hypothetical protein
MAMTNSEIKQKMMEAIKIAEECKNTNMGLNAMIDITIAILAAEIFRKMTEKQ